MPSWTCISLPQLQLPAMNSNWGIETHVKEGELFIPSPRTFPCSYMRTCQNRIAHYYGKCSFFGKLRLREATLSEVSKYTLLAFPAPPVHGVYAPLFHVSPFILTVQSCIVELIIFSQLWSDLINLNYTCPKTSSMHLNFS